MKILRTTERPRSRYGLRRGGLTLVEMLISVTLTLLIVFAVVQIFQVLGDTVTLGRATIEMSGQLRMVAERLQTDLDNITCPMRPPLDPAQGAGYFFYNEGVNNDALYLQDIDSDGKWNDLDLAAANPNLGPHYGDTDDVVAMTVKVGGKGFYDTASELRSHTAEVVWWVAVLDINEDGVNDASDPLVLLRREKFVRPNVSGANLGDLTHPTGRVDLSTLPTFLTVYDDSGNGGDPPNMGINAAGDDYSQFIIANDVLSFDVRIYDPEAPLYDSGASFALAPGDAGYVVAAADAFINSVDPIDPIGIGAFVDLGYWKRAIDINTSLSGSTYPSQLSNVPYNLHMAQHPGMWPDENESFYDTWSTGFDRDLINNDIDSDSDIDEGSNGLDDDSVNGVDDPGEREFPPPYDVPARGIEIRIRIWEVGTGQVRQVSVVGNFVPN